MRRRNFLMQIVALAASRGSFGQEVADNNKIVKIFNNKDSVFDYSLTIQSAVDYLSYVGGGTVFLDKGVFQVASPIVLRDNVTLQGAGLDTVVLGDFAKPFNRILTTDFGNLSVNIKILDLVVDRRRKNSQHGILLGGVDGLVIDNVAVVGYGPEVMSGAIGISAFDDSARFQSKNVIVRNVTVIEGNNFGVAFGNVSQGLVENCYFLNCYREALGFEAWGDGTEMKGVNPHRTLGVVENCVARNNYFHMSDDPRFFFRGYPGPAIFIGGATSHGLCLDCLFEHNFIKIVSNSSTADYKGISVFGGASLKADRILIKDNFIQGAPGEGVSVGMKGFVTGRVDVVNNVIVGCNDKEFGIYGPQISYRYSEIGNCNHNEFYSSTYQSRFIDGGVDE